MTDLFSIVVLRNWANVTPMKQFDYVAYIEGQEERAELYGYGETRAEALEQLGVAIVERVDDRLYDLVEAGEVDPDVFTEIDSLTYVPY